jgi:hypothetical protein
MNSVLKLLDTPSRLMCCMLHFHLYLHELRDAEYMIEIFNADALKYMQAEKCRQVYSHYYAVSANNG